MQSFVWPKSLGNMATCIEDLLTASGGEEDQSSDHCDEERFKQRALDLLVRVNTSQKVLGLKSPRAQHSAAPRNLKHSSTTQRRECYGTNRTKIQIKPADVTPRRIYRPPESKNVKQDTAPAEKFSVGQRSPQNLSKSHKSTSMQVQIAKEKSTKIQHQHTSRSSDRASREQMHTKRPATKIRNCYDVTFTQPGRLGLVCEDLKKVSDKILLWRLFLDLSAKLFTQTHTSDVGQFNRVNCDRF